MRKRIVFVDEETQSLQRLKDSLNSLSSEWDMVFTMGGDAALEMLSELACDVVVTGVHTAGMTGSDLLERIKDRNPEIVRILRFDFSDEEVFFRSVRYTHQYLSDFSDPNAVAETLSRAFYVRDLLSDRGLARLISQVHTLPSLPSLYLRIIDEISSLAPSLPKIARIISSDVSMSTKMLQLVNSVVYGLRVKITDPVRAAVYLGLDMIKGLTLSAHVFAQFEKTTKMRATLGDLWDHSMNVGVIAQKVLESQGCGRSVIEEGFVAGLLHDVGKVVLVANLPDTYAEALRLVREDEMPLVEAERAIFGATHAEVGAYLIGLWGLSQSLIETLLYHHVPAESGDEKIGPLTAVHVANVLERGRGRADAPGPDEEHLDRLGLLDRLETWTRIANPQ